MLISQEYLDLNTTMHADMPGYGISGWHWIGPIIHYLRKVGGKTVLDYGAGKGSLKNWMPPEYPVTNYDPVTFPDDPEPQDFVVCLDVMEHIEPVCLDDVIAHMRSKALKGAFVVISTREAQKTLKDGRNAHLIIQDEKFWLPAFGRHFGQMKKIEVGRKDELVLFLKV